jgi:hypothetical protein
MEIVKLSGLVTGLSQETDLVVQQVGTIQTAINKISLDPNTTPLVPPTLTGGETIVEQLSDLNKQLGYANAILGELAQVLSEVI